MNTQFETQYIMKTQLQFTVVSIYRNKLKEVLIFNEIFHNKLPGFASIHL